MSNIFITLIDGSGTYAIPTNDAELSAATSGLDTIVSGVANLSYDRLLAWVEDQGGPNGAEGVRTLNAVVEKFTYSGEICPDETEVDTMTAAIEAALEADANINTIGQQQVSIFDPGQNFYWERDAAGYIYPAASADDVAVGPDSAPTGMWFEDGDMVLGAAAMSDTEKLRVVGNARIEGEALFTEQTSVAITPAASEGVFWVKDGAPGEPFFTDGDGVDHRLATAAPPQSLPSIDQVLFVDKTGGAYVADGSMQLPYNSIASAIAAATALVPSTSNRILIVLYPGVYTEAITTADDFVYFAGYDRRSTIIRQSVGTSPPLTIANDNTSFHNLTFEVDTTHTGQIVSCSANLGGEVRFLNCGFLGNGSASANNYFFLTGVAALDLIFGGCVFAQSDDTALIFYSYSSGVVTMRFVDCEFDGVFWDRNSQATSMTDARQCEFRSSNTETAAGTVQIDASRSSGGHHFKGCRILNTSTTGYAVYGGTAFETALFAGCFFYGGTSSVNIQASTGAHLFTANCYFDRGIGDNLVPGDHVMYVGSPDQALPFHQDLPDAINALNAISTTPAQYEINLLEDQTLAAQLPTPGTSRDVLIDGQGLFTIDRTGNTVVQTGASRTLRFSRVQVLGEVYTTGNSSELFFERSRVEGRVRFEGSDADAFFRSHDSAFVGDATYNEPIYINVATGAIYLSGDYLIGHTASAAVRYGTTVGVTYDFDTLYMERVKCFHQSLGTNNPFVGAGQGSNGDPPVNTYYAHTCTFNQEPALADPTYLLNAIDSAQRQNCLDPDGNFTWQVAW
jgi:hypothetical protein